MDLNILTVILLFSFITPTKIMAYSHPRKGFSLELIHRDSIQSPPLYRGNLTQHSKFHIEPQDVNIRPRVVYDNIQYMVRLGIGSPPTDLHLVLDTGSSLVWTQCEPCTSCFDQDGPKFKPGRSGSFQPIPCNHPLCKPPSFQCRGNQCVYNQRYADNTFTGGVLATDHLTFASRTGQPETIPNMVFGCSHASSRRMFGSTKVGGIMGMDFKEESFIMQLANGINGSSRFSYCFPRDPHTISYIRFGRDIIQHRNLRRTPIINYNNLFYHILEDISVVGERMHFPAGTFDLHPDGSGGCLADTGTPSSRMIRQPYARVKAAFMKYFENFKLRIVSGGDIGADLCYEMPRNFRHFPSMEYHFRGANLFVAGEKMVMILRGRFCLTLLPTDRNTKIGAAHQQDVQFVYDLREKLAYIGPANCARV